MEARELLASRKEPLEERINRLRDKGVAAGGSGKTHAAVTGNGSQTLRYKTGASQAAPGLGDDISGWTAFPADGEIAVTATHYLVVASEVNGKAVACARMQVSADQIGA